MCDVCVSYQAGAVVGLSDHTAVGVLVTSRAVVGALMDAFGGTENEAHGHVRIGTDGQRPDGGYEGTGGVR